MESDTTYYYRIALESDDGAFPGLEGQDVVKGTFRTLPDSDEDTSATLSVGNLGSNGYGGCLEEVRGGGSRGLALLGGSIPPKAFAAIGNKRLDPKGSLREFRAAHQAVWSNPEGLSKVAARLPLWCAFNDATKGSDDALLAEEAALSGKSKSKSKNRKR